MTTNTGKAIIKTLAVIPILFFFIYLYTFLHEGGHALVGIIYGGKIDRFVLGFDAHVTIHGAKFTQLGESLFNLAGTLLPVICLVVALILYNRNIKNLVYHFIYAESTIMIIGSLIAWIAIPVISLFTAPPSYDDVSKFMEVSDLNPLLISFTALILMFLLVLLAYKKGLFSKIKEILNVLKSLSPDKHKEYNKPQAGAKRQAAVLALTAIIFGISALFLYQILGPNKVFEASFSMNIQEDIKDVKMSFDVNKHRSYKMDIKLDAEGMLTDINIYDDKGSIVYQNISEQFTLSSFINLEPGNYSFMLTFIRDPEVMVQYFEEKGYMFSREELNRLKEVFEKKRYDEFIPVSFSVVIK